MSDAGSCGVAMMATTVAELAERGTNTVRSAGSEVTRSSRVVEETRVAWTVVTTMAEEGVKLSSEPEVMRLLAGAAVNVRSVGTLPTKCTTCTDNGTANGSFQCQ